MQSAVSKPSDGLPKAQHPTGHVTASLITLSLRIHKQCLTPPTGCLSTPAHSVGTELEPLTISAGDHQHTDRPERNAVLYKGEVLTARAKCQHLLW